MCEVVKLSTHQPITRFYVFETSSGKANQPFLQHKGKPQEGTHHSQVRAPRCLTGPAASLPVVAVTMQHTSATRATPLPPPPPLTSVLVALRSTLGERIGALPHVVGLISACMDHALPDFWSIPRACEAKLMSLLPRLAWCQSHDAAVGFAAVIDPFYWKYQCSLGLVAAVKHSNLAMVEWLHEYCPIVLPYAVMIEAASAGNCRCCSG